MKTKIPLITIGLDLGDKKHAICVLNQDGKNQRNSTMRFNRRQPLQLNRSLIRRRFTSNVRPGFHPMNTPNTTPLDVDAKTEKKIKSLRKSMEQIVIFTLIGCIIPLLWPFLIVFGPVYALQRRSLLKNPVISDWLDANANVSLKDLAEYPTTEGGVARIKISGLRPWIPVVLPIVACFVMIGLSSFL